MGTQLRDKSTQRDNIIMERYTVCVMALVVLSAVSLGQAWKYYCDCKETTIGLDYDGNIATTKSGYTCQRWDSQTPHKHNKNDVTIYPNAINNEANYCRNPNKKSKGPWCYTTDSPSKVRYEYCDIPLCSTCIDYCDPNPCRNGGVCTSKSGGYTCKCPVDCSGSTCEYCVKTVTAGSHTFKVMEETDIQGHRWTLLMRRYDGSVDFVNKKWDDFKDGFGNVKKEFWLGNDKMHELTSGKRIIARFDITSFDGRSRYAEYDEFGIGPESDDYTLRLGIYSGNADDAMRGSYGNLRDQPFTTSDRDNDNYSKNCAVKYRGAWWYDSCSHSKFTGDYGRTVPFGTGIHWQSLETGLKQVDIKIREREGFHAPGRVETVTAGGHSFKVVVDTDSAGQDWMVLMRRYDGYVDFSNRKWQDYKEGFGDLTTEFWLGNDNMNYLTHDGKYYIVRFDMKSFKGGIRYAEYGEFVVGPESEGYKLSLGEYSGNAGDAMQGFQSNLRHQPFTTSDRDNDNYFGNCAVQNHGGWWYDACSQNKFTGDYGQTVNLGTGIHWNTFLPSDTGLQYVDIKIRQKKGSSQSGRVETVSADGHTFKVVVDTDSEGQEWIVLMRRNSGLVDFTEKTWAEYRDGFGDFLTEFWLGNDNMHYLTSNGKYHVVRFEMETFSGQKRYAEYDNFDVGPESDGYRLRLGEYRGNAGDAMLGSDANLRHQRFTTSDRDNDNYRSGNCASKYHGGWWYDSCFSSKFTGDYGQTVPYGSGIHWQTYQALTTGLKSVEIKMREHETSPFPGHVSSIRASGKSFDVLRQSDSAGDEWIVLMRRYDGFVEFANREWDDFKEGFGDFSTEFWLGNDKMFYLTKKKRYIVRFDMMSYSGAKRYAEYDKFAVGPESDGYRLTIGEYSGNAGDAMRGAYGNLEHQQFTTTDRDNDNYGRNCAVKNRGGWWYDSCAFSKFTGDYGQTVDYGTGIHWNDMVSGLKYVDIKIKPK